MQTIARAARRVKSGHLMLSFPDVGDRHGAHIAHISLRSRSAGARTRRDRRTAKQADVPPLSVQPRCHAAAAP